MLTNEEPQNIELCGSIAPGQRKSENCPQELIRLSMDES